MDHDVKSTNAKNDARSIDGEDRQPSVDTTGDGKLADPLTLLNTASVVTVILEALSRRPLRSTTSSPITAIRKSSGT